MWIFGRGVSILLDFRVMPSRLRKFSHLKCIVFGTAMDPLEHAACYLEVGESLLLGLAQQRLESFRACQMFQALWRC